MEPAHPRLPRPVKPEESGSDAAIPSLGFLDRVFFMKGPERVLIGYLRGSPWLGSRSPRSASGRGLVFALQGSGVLARVPFRSDKCPKPSALALNPEP